MIKDLEDTRLAGLKAYSPSQGLKKAEILYEKEAEKALKNFGKENVVYADSYLDKYHNTQIQYTKYDKLKYQ